MNPFKRKFYSSIITLNVPLEEHINLKNKVDNFKESTKTKKPPKK